MLKLNLRIFLFLSLFSANLIAQYKPLKRNKVTDSLWAEGLALHHNLKNHSRPYDTGKRAWQYNSTIYYSSDRYIRIAQTKAYNAYGSYYFATLQFNYKGTQYDKTFGDNTDILLNFPIKHIYKLPGKPHSYLILCEGEELTYDYGEQKQIPNSIFNAVTFRLKDDTLKPIEFLETESLDNDEEDDTLIGYDNLSIYSLKESPVSKTPQRFLKYDSIKQQLSYTYIYSYGATFPFVGIVSDSYDYCDSAFVLRKDSTGYFPPLAKLTDTVSISKIKRGNNIIKTTTVHAYGIIDNSDKEIGLYTRRFFEINGVPLTIDNIEIERDSLTSDTTLLCKVMDDSSLLIPTCEYIVGNGPGACGMCDNEYFGFYSYRQNQAKVIAGMGFNLGMMSGSYNYDDCQGKAKRRIGDRGGYFYFNKDDNTFIIFENEADDADWENNTSFLIKIHGNNSSESSYRGFRLKFNTSNGQTCVDMIIDKDVTDSGLNEEKKDQKSPQSPSNSK